jgi:signal transduction histidine kinase
MILVYFLYGLGFFVTGLAILLETSRRSELPIAYGLPLLAAFGIIHGSHEWIEMFQLIAEDSSMQISQALRLPILAVSFTLLLEFGIRILMLDASRRWRLVRWAALSAFLLGEGLVWAKWGRQENWLAAADAYCRYSLAIPGAVLAAAGLFRQSRQLARQQIGISRDITIVGIAFLLYGIPGQILVCPSPLPPSNVFNNALFIEIFGFPIQVVRTAMALVVAFFTVRSLRIFEFERQRQMNELSQAQAEAQRRLDEERAEQERLRTELLRQTVLAQEEERRHIARELHDEASQALTAVAWELASAEELMVTQPAEIRGRVAALRRLTEQVMNNIRQLITRLRPAVLDELGLVPALIAHADDCSARFRFTVDVEITGERRRLPSEIETTLYRIVQESLTNVVKHAQATHASVRLHFNHQEATLSVSDNGVGMDVEAARRAASNGKGWGLAGISERVNLVAGNLDIRSSPGTGTDINVRVPIPPPPLTLEEETRETDPTAAG